MFLHLIPALKTLVEGMSQPDRMPQIEVAVGGARTVLLLRHLEALTPDDLDRLRHFADAWNHLVPAAQGPRYR
jgi:23S rRNA (uracil1939-C5)-methyltransferase